MYYYDSFTGEEKISCSKSLDLWLPTSRVSDAAMSVDNSKIGKRKCERRNVGLLQVRRNNRCGESLVRANYWIHAHHSLPSPGYKPHVMRHPLYKKNI